MTDVRGVDEEHAAGPGSGVAGRALAWSFTNTVVARFGTLAIGIALARILGPEEFGTFAVALVALLAILSFNELGVSLAIVRWQGEPEDIAPTVATISLGMSAVLTAVAILAAPWFAGAMGDPSATPLVRLLSLCVLINGLVATPAALMQRRFRQGQRMVADQVNVWVGAFVSIGLALVGVGAMSLVVGRLAGAALSAFLFLYYSPVPFRLGLDRLQARALLVFGLPLAGASIIVFLVGFLDQLMVGHLLGASVLGFYVLAANLANWPVSLFSQPLRSVAPALFSRMQHDRALMHSSFGQLLRPLAAVSFVVCGVIAVTAPDLVRFVYGPDWAPAGPILRWLAVMAAFRILFELAYDFLVVLGRSGTILRLQVVWIVVLVPAVWIGIETWGAPGAAAALVAVSALVSCPLYVIEFRRVSIAPRELLRPLVMPLAVATTAVVIAAVIGAVMDATFATLAVTGVVTGLVLVLTVARLRDDLTVLRREVGA